MKLLVVGVRGLGGHLARHFAARGWEVTVAARTQASVEALAAEIHGTPLVMDMLQPPPGLSFDLVVAAQTSAAKWSLKPVMESDPEQLRQRFEGYPLATLKLLQALKTRTFIQIGTTLEARPRPGFGVMHAAQHATRALLAAAAQELKPAGVHVVYLAVEGQIGRDIPASEIARAVEYVAGQDERAWTHELALRSSKSSTA